MKEICEPTKYTIVQVEVKSQKLISPPLNGGKITFDSEKGLPKTDVRSIHPYFGCYIDIDTYI